MVRGNREEQSSKRAFISGQRDPASVFTVIGLFSFFSSRSLVEITMRHSHGSRTAFHRVYIGTAVIGRVLVQAYTCVIKGTEFDGNLYRSRRIASSSSFSEGSDCLRVLLYAIISALHLFLEKIKTRCNGLCLVDVYTYIT